MTNQKAQFTMQSYTGNIARNHKEKGFYAEKILLTMIDGEIKQLVNARFYAAGNDTTIINSHA
jgi:hypothetical protein